MVWSSINDSFTNHHWGHTPTKTNIENILMSIIGGSGIFVVVAGGVDVSVVDT